ncbi:MAG: DUF4837 family protein [Ignavibacteria bacterium]|nr:DUF4837 family protein [Ignavibacteria bacterium]
MKKFFLIIPVFTYLLVSIGCQQNLKPAIGKEDEIIVLADSSSWNEYYDFLSAIFEKEIITPQPEQLFILKRIDFSQFKKYQNRKNILIVTTLNQNNEVTDYVKSILDSSALNLIRDGKEFVIKKKDVWAKNQVLVILVSNTLEELRIKSFKDKDNLLYFFQSASDERVMKNLYNPTYEKKDLEAKYLKEYGWKLYIQADFLEAINNKENNFVWLRRSPNSDMERWIFIHWIDSVDSRWLNFDSVIVIRNRITQKFLRTTDDKAYVEIAGEYLRQSEVNFNGKYAIFTQGLWRMNDYSMGGPFVNYVFLDQKRNRLYMLDGSVFSPRYEKKSLIQQVDVTLKTFRTSDELTKEEIDALLKYLK